LSIPLLAALLVIWEQSVLATHHFLTPNGINSLKPYCEEGLQAVKLLVAMDGQQPVAFLGLIDHKVEMLFVAPSHFRKGVGSRLLKHAVDQHQVRYVDVNEQNPDALAFYQQMGFVVYERTETDTQGNAFPILKMTL
jgi:putative acetyltransferase